MRPIPKANLRPTLAGKKVFLDRPDHPIVQDAVHAVMHKYVFLDSGKSYPIEEYRKTWRIWSENPDQISQAAAPWLDEPARLVSGAEFGMLDKYVGYTLEFLDPRTAEYVAKRVALKETFRESLQIAVDGTTNTWRLSGYGKTWRLWTGKPTAEEMEGVPWQ